MQNILEIEKTQGVLEIKMYEKDLLSKFQGSSIHCFREINMS